MKRTQYTAEFKAEAVKKIIEKGHPATEVSCRLGLPVGLLYTRARKVRGIVKIVCHGLLWGHLSYCRFTRLRICQCQVGSITFHLTPRFSVPTEHLI